MLDVEGSVRGTPESYIQKVKVQHKGNGRLFEPKANHIRSFGIHHFASRVIYDASDFLGELCASHGSVLSSFNWVAREFIFLGILCTCP